MSHSDGRAIAEYYDAQALNKVRDAIDGNQRIKLATSTIYEWSPERVRRVLEIGCGVGHMCWRMGCRWKSAEIVGIDPSPMSVSIAERLFSSTRVSYVQGSGVPECVGGKFDLVVLMDVYEHIPRHERQALHAGIGRAMSPGGRVFLSFPTPRHQRWLREKHPGQMQPVDEDIVLATVQEMASDLCLKVLLYQEVDVWHNGDYAHAVLGEQGAWCAVPSRGFRLLPILRQALKQWYFAQRPWRFRRRYVHGRLSAKQT